SGIAVISRQSSPAPAPVAAAGQPTMRLLSQAARACHTMTYAGMEVLGARSEPGPATSVVTVWHTPDAVTLAETLGAGPRAYAEAPRIVLPASSLRGQALVASVMLGMSPRLAALLSANYRVAAAGWRQVAGRPARVITATRRNGKLAARFWLD